MARIFEEHVRRRVTSLNGFWKCLCDREDIGISEKWYMGLPSGRSVAVPSVWNTEKEHLTYEGVFWYEKSFFSDGGDLRFCFEAVMTEARVWLDGVEIGSHYGGFSEFDIIVPSIEAGNHRLSVRVDNRFDSQSIPQAKVDWYHYGGIPRGVRVEALKGICVLRNRLEYTLSPDREVCGRFVLELYNADASAKSTKLIATLDGTEISSAAVTVDGKSRLSFALPAFTLKDVRVWDVGSPELYTVHIFTDTDDLYDRVGFRSVEVRDGKILLNGKETELRGVNRHEEHPEFGFAFPRALMQRDIDLILDMGCNTVRGSHYPNSREMLDLLDERGILFWSEIPIWGVGFSVEALADEVVVERGLEMHREMVRDYYNHPSIVIWGMHNEIATDTIEAYRMSECYYDFLKKNGGNRLVTFASYRPMEDICLELCDVISLNQYFGWYYGYEDDAWESFLERFCLRLEELGLSDKPIIMSEFGCAAMYGCHDGENILWSEENQAKQISHCLELFHAHPAVVGSYIWQFCDIRTCLEVGINRARGFNNKGLLNEYRKPKLAYRAAKELYNRFANE